MTSSDAPQPPGTPLREDAPEGGFSPDAEREELPDLDPQHGSAPDDTDVPPVSHESEQSDAAADLQEENAETTLDQPSQ
ncbi:hypothetical protein [Nocardioides flavescens]|uniref:Uncharacterized protein n=1 Tax=Nocardioides flavescens TaxID=2691959 RepID=A0A6L7ERU5_9ACTN|nr:hypothetical protein [Nocardioides flavescens]MXG90023.1 hypothetical protein [Nocardioides flavescens]